MPLNRKYPLAELLEGSREFTRELAEGVGDHRAQLDALISEHAHGWVLSRIAPLELSIMRGALYEVDETHLALLDQHEGVPRSYRRETISVFDDDAQEREVFTYIANQTGRFAPSRMYLDLIVTGAREHKLPEEYIASIEQVRT